MGAVLQGCVQIVSGMKLEAIQRYKVSSVKRNADSVPSDEISVVRIQVAHLPFLFPSEMCACVTCTIALAVLVGDEQEIADTRHSGEANER